MFQALFQGFFWKLLQCFLQKLFLNSFRNLYRYVLLIISQIFLRGFFWNFNRNPSIIYSEKYVRKSCMECFGNFFINCCLNLFRNYFRCTLRDSLTNSFKYLIRNSFSVSFWYSSVGIHVFFFKSREFHQVIITKFSQACFMDSYHIFFLLLVLHKRLKVLLQKFL